LLFLLNGLALNGQSDFRPGVIILNSGDTIRGEIDLRNNTSMSKQCVFRKDDKSEKKIYSPDVLAAYRMDNGRYFVSRNIQNLGQVFLEYLVNGKLSLYYFVDMGSNRYYVQKEGDILREMPKEPEFEYIDGTKQYRPPRQLRGLLSVLTEEAPELKENINRIDLKSQKNLVDFTVDYHNAVCPDEGCMVYKKKIPFKVSVQPVVGYVRYFSTGNGNFEAGANVNIWLPVENERIYFRTGMFFGNFPAEGELAYGGNHPDGVYHQGYVKIPLTFRYLAPSNTLRPEVSIGEDVYIGKDLNLGYLFNLSGALNVTINKDKLYWTIGGGVSSTPLVAVFFNNMFRVISATAFTGLYFKF